MSMRVRGGEVSPKWLIVGFELERCGAGGVCSYSFLDAIFFAFGFMIAL